MTYPKAPPTAKKATSMHLRIKTPAHSPKTKATIKVSEICFSSVNHPTTKSITKIPTRITAASPLKRIVINLKSFLPTNAIKRPIIIITKEIMYLLFSKNV